MKILNISNHQLYIFIIFLLRDLKVYSARFKRYLINYTLFFPILFALCFGYMLPQLSPLSHILKNGTIFLGSILVVLFPMSFNMLIDILIDLEQERFTDYQITKLNPLLFIIEKVLFCSSVIFIFLLPFLPITKAFLGNQLDLNAIQILPTIAMLYASSLIATSFTMMAICLLKDSSQSRKFWRRCNIPLMITGGFLAPYEIMSKVSPVLRTLTIFNPMLYVTEGLRSAVLNDAQFISYKICIPVIFIYSCIFIVLANKFLKKKMDYV
ncbi:ABC transporter permease [Candidatus Dependentiae bacterium]|nr:ABC transporter permease [Candidatus Dependentiae bacterium]